MSGTQWTKQQEHAINTDNRSLIVSAAAGSGKTAVLVERIINKISGRSGTPCDIRELLVVTFTNAAAAEMRAKISSAVSAALAEDYKNKRLRRQLALIPSAHIETVHAFCLSLIRENFNLIGISPDFRMADSAETDMLKELALNQTLEEFYSLEDKNDVFFAACEALTDGKDDRKLCRTVLEIYEKIRSYPMPDRYIGEIKRYYDVEDNTKTADTLWGKYLISRAEAVLESAQNTLIRALDMIEQCADVKAAYAPALQDDLNAAKKLEALAAGGDWQGAYEFCRAHKSARLGAVRNYEDKDFLERIKSMRETWKKTLADICEKIFDCSEEQAMADILASKKIVNGLFDVISEFENKYAATKRKRNIADFSDLEHMAISLLINADENGNICRTELAQRLSEHFAEIMVDEYQDTNAAQDMIFRALSKDGKNLFMVGDVKQSIYKFRLANPGIFIEKYEKYEDIERAADGEPASISMNKNFRSRKQVINAVNYIFRSTMSKTLGDLDYTDGEWLNPGAEYEDEDNSAYDSELYILDAKEQADGEENAPGKSEKEAEFVAGRIKKLIDGKFQITDKQSGELRAVKPKDFAILLRSVSGKSEIYKKYLEREGIYSSSEQAGEFFMTEEILTVTALLQVLDGISRERALVGIMRSAVYNFSAAELAEIRVNFPDVPFYQAVINQAYDAPDGKCAEFLRDVEKYRQYAADFPLSQTIWKFYTDKDLTALFSACGGGEKRAANLMAFYEYSKGFDGAGGGLSRFIKVIEKASQSGNVPVGILNSDGENSVKIMSIHKSKGLEFPVVVVPDCAKRFNFEDVKDSVLFNDIMGMGIKLRQDGNFEHTTVIRNAVADKIKSETLSEELRILYVALTRAKEKLIMTMSLASAETSIKKWAEAAHDGKIDAETLKNQNSPAMWMAAPFVFHKDGGDIRSFAADGRQIIADGDFSMKIEVVGGAKSAERQSQNSAADETGAQTVPQGAEMSEGEKLEIRQKLEYQYPYKAETEMPSKVTPTMAKGRFFDSEAEEYTEISARVPRLDKPEFDRTELSAAQIGIAHHVAMQFMDFSACTDRAGIEREIKRLADKHILSDSQIKAIDIRTFERFFNSELAQRIRKSDNVMREFKFSVLCPAGKFFSGTSGTDSVLLQGVIDCAFEQDGGFVILDFKSDSVKDGYEQTAAEKYREQLGAYAYAVEEITGKKVSQTVLYFFKTGAAVQINNEVGEKV